MSHRFNPHIVEIMEKTLPYMGYYPEYTDEEVLTMDKRVPDVDELSTDEAVNQIKEAGFTPAPPTVVSDFHMTSGYEAMKQLLADRPDIDGVFCATDSMGQGAMMALKEAGKKVPEDVSVVAFGNDWANLVSTPQLTTAELYQTQCGRDAAAILLDILEKESDPEYTRQIKLGYRIVERGSV